MIKLKRLGNKKGQAMVETALVLPLLVLIMALIVSLGQLINGQIVCNNASYEGARKAVAISDKSQAISTAKSIAKDYAEKNGIGLENVKCTYTISGDGSWQKPNDLTFTVTADVNILFGIFRRDKPLTGEITIMIERD